MKIKEFSKLYGVTTHTLRYYEECGLLYPSYDENGYRNYSYNDMQTMNIIRDLRYFDIPLLEIKNFFETRNISKTKKLIEQELEVLESKISDMKKKKKLLNERLNSIIETENIKLNKPKLAFYPRRGIIKGQHIFNSPEDIDYELKTLHQEFAELLKSNNQNIFGTMFFSNKNVDEYKVFYFSEDSNVHNSKQGDFLPEGNYVTYTFKGAYDQIENAIKKVIDFINTNSLKMVSPIYQLFLIDFHETNSIDEYYTKIEVLVEYKSH